MKKITLNSGITIQVNKKFYDHIKEHNCILFYRVGQRKMDKEFFNYNDLFCYLCKTNRYNEYLEDVEENERVLTQEEYYNSLKSRINRFYESGLYGGCFYGSFFYDILISHKYITEIN